MSQDVEDYAILADPQFDPYLFANDLLNITNPNIQQELDISTSIKKVKFDLNDLELQLKELIIQDSNDSIITELLRNTESDSNEFNQINDSLTNINSNFKRLKNDLLNPYNEIEIYLNILKKVHNTSSFVRDVTYFIFLVSKIQNEEEEINDDNILKLSKFHSNLINHLNLNKNLKSLKLIRDYNSIHLKKLSSLENLLSKDLSSSLNDLLINKKFNLLNNKDLLDHFKIYTNSLYLINKEKLSELINQFYTKLLSNSLNNLIKILTSSNQSLKILNELIEKFNLFLNILNLFKSININSNSNLFNLFLSLFPDVKNPPEFQFWIYLLNSFKKNLTSTIHRGGPVQKQLKSNKNDIIKNFTDLINDLELINKDKIIKLINEIFSEIDKK